jgi:hypothetical protein
MDVITYPVRGQTLVYHEGAGQCMFDGRAGPN